MPLGLAAGSNPLAPCAREPLRRCGITTLAPSYAITFIARLGLPYDVAHDVRSYASSRLPVYTQFSGRNCGEIVARIMPVASSPIIDDVDARPAITGFVPLVHAHALEPAAVAPREEELIRLVPRQVRPGQQRRHAYGKGKCLARVQHTSVVLLRFRCGPNRAELDEAQVGAGFAARPVVTNRESRHATVALYQNRVAQTLGIHCRDLLGQVEAGVECFRDLAAGTQGGGLVGIAQGTEARGAGDRAGLPRGRCHHRGQEPRVKP